MSARVKTLSAGFVVVRRFGGEWRYLLLRCYKLWDFPKGVVEGGETPLQAALREVAEETSLSGLELQWGEIFCDTEIYANAKLARYFLAYSPGGEVVLGINPELGRPEHHAFVWADFATAIERIPSRLTPILLWANTTITTPNANAG